MITHEKMLAVMNGYGPQNPMPLADIVEQAGIPLEACEVILQQMYHSLPSTVNRAEITRHGLKQVYYWPTGVVDRAKWSEMTISPKKRPTFPSPVRRDEVKPKPPVLEIAQTKTEEITMTTEGKSKTLQILEFIEQNPNACHKAFRKTIGVLGFDAFIRKDINDGSVIKTKGAKLITYCLAPGLTAEVIFKKRQQNTIANMEAALERASKPAAQPASSNQIANDDIPAFLRKDQPKPIPDADIKMAAELQLPETYPVTKGNTGKFGLAISSDRTLTIKGKSAEPIELDEEETLKLLNFIDGVSMLWPAL